MKLMTSSLVSSAFLVGLLIAGCNAAPAAGPQGPAGPQGSSDHDKDRDRDRDRDADQGRRDQVPSCPAGQHHDSDGGCIRD
jgi:Ni/Co efflux regulator RcnB